jgi:uncharacterized membrane protein HdeD (DUF308 family)
MSTHFAASTTAALDEERANLRRFSLLFLILGLVSILIGVLAIGAPHVATNKAIVIFGVLLLIAGVTEVIHAVMVRNLRGFAIHLLAAVLYLIVGVFVLEEPERAAGVLTLLLAASFFVAGLLRVLFAIVERFPAWPYVLFNGAVDLFLGVFIWRGWPESSLWVIGLFIGIELVLHGFTWVFLGLSARAIRTAPSS